MISLKTRPVRRLEGPRASFVGVKVETLGAGVVPMSRNRAVAVTVLLSLATANPK
jgi:hypothetical protein